MLRTAILSAVVLAGTAVGTIAQPYPLPPQPLPPQPLPQVSGIVGPWFFRGDPSKPCYIQSVPGPRGNEVVLTNEKGSPSNGHITRDGLRVIAYDWGNLVGTYRGNAIVWPNGDFWAR